MSNRKHHYLKTESVYFKSIERDEKKFELRKNDRDFKPFDIVHLVEVVNGVTTGRVIGNLEIKYILYGGKYGLPEDYCIFNW
jgi:hypothetical protein